jgi:hypothetical protein
MSTSRSAVFLASPRKYEATNQGRPAFAQHACTLGTLVSFMKLRQIERIIDGLIEDRKDLRRTLAASPASRV